MLDYLEEDKEKLLSDLQAAGTPEKAVLVLETEYDRLLYRYNEQPLEEKHRTAAAYMMQSARMSLPLMDTLGETVVWERNTVGEKTPFSLPKKTWILLIAGAVCSLAAFLPSAAAGAGNGRVLGTLMAMLFFAGGMAGIYFGGYFAGRQKSGQGSSLTGKAALMTENRVDAGKIYRCLHAVLMIIDQNLEKQQEEVPVLLTDEAGGKVLAAQDEAALLSDLLEAYYSHDGEFALERIGEVRYYLHRNHIEAVDYEHGREEWFDLMPSMESGTIRPALIEDGKLVRKGLAAIGKEN